MNINFNNKYAANFYTYFWMLLSTLILMLTFSTASYAHRGPANEIDNCRIKVGTERIHLSVYTPEFSQGTGYCQFIPYVGKTEMVFDYEGKKLRDVSIEFEVTKEPEGTRIFYQAPEKIKKGTVDASIDFSKFGAGEYLTHITIVNQGEKLDSHLTFFIGEKENKVSWVIYTFIVIAIALVILFTKLTRANKQTDQ